MCFSAFSEWDLQCFSQWKLRIICTRITWGGYYMQIPGLHLRPTKINMSWNPGNFLKYGMLQRLVQDGRVEGRALIPSCESTGITTNCWTIIDRNTLELTKKDIPHPKTKEKPQWDGRRGTITIKSNLITAGWVTHKLENTYTTKVHPLEWRFRAQHQASQSRGLATGGGIPRESDFEG